MHNLDFDAALLDRDVAQLFFSRNILLVNPLLL
jgi:hypothetical protein